MIPGTQDDRIATSSASSSNKCPVVSRLIEIRSCLRISFKKLVWVLVATKLRLGVQDLCRENQEYWLHSRGIFLTSEFSLDVSWT